MLQGGREGLEELLAQLADELLDAEAELVIYMVGGSWLMWFDERDATRDVDSMTTVPDAAAPAIAKVAERHDLDPAWVNGRAAAFVPSGFDVNGCEVAYQRGPLTVWLPTPDTIFVMKLLRADPPDRDDMVRIWPRCSFDSAEAAVVAFCAAYPHEEPDPHLGGFVQAIASEAVES